MVTRLLDHAAVAVTNARLYSEVTAANIAKSEFVGIVAHDLKVPMTSIMGMLYTSGSASDNSGFTALPMPEFCMYTSAASPVPRK